ncbi:diacylglycerol/lipid kinase family protein [Pseudemcibacter aquimaris]|uniref:diacylglycerol/lipid kinase family protein n=1 Tax=Pseudemcibacter aquimaris TaxID=2857064 RepID=UPI002010D9E4|nr:diacylglycerol kinase family protein [Pseudemcibacter aquimaris]MCC3859743.1 diacylglycerol kinase family lipid kinase [Pseudemcibacter aquimaris]WDU60137.1 diacylglycerol kinase family lipid kinase [Pseudemcibacter aquimaris]
MRFLIIYNPNAGQRRQKLFESVLSVLDARMIDYTLIKTEYAGHGTEIAKAFSNKDEFDVITAAGGDGTINEVLNGIYGTDKPLGIIPMGTANVLAKELGIKINVHSIVSSLTNGNTASIYPAKINDQYFTLMASVGYDALAVKNVNLSLKKKIGEVAYFIAFLKEIFFGDKRQYYCEIDGILHPCASAIVTNGKFYAGKYVCAPNASLHDQMLHAILFKNKGAWAAIKYFIAIMTSRLAGRDDIDIIDVKSVKLKSDVVAPVQIDGDHYGELPVSVSIADNPITLMVP